MSLVGPRPLVVDEDRQVEGWHRRRLQLTPGMTGPWQILGPLARPAQGDGRDRLPLRGQLVPVDRHQDPVAHRSPRPRETRTLEPEAIALVLTGAMWWEGLVPVILRAVKRGTGVDADASDATASPRAAMQHRTTAKAAIAIQAMGMRNSSMRGLWPDHRSGLQKPLAACSPCWTHVQRGRPGPDAGRRCGGRRRSRA